MTPEERARNVLDAKTFPHDLSCEMDEEAEETLIDLIKFQIREAQREAVEKAQHKTLYLLQSYFTGTVAPLHLKATKETKNLTEVYAGACRLVTDHLRSMFISELTPEKILGE